VYDAIILKDLINGMKKNSADFENSYLALQKIVLTDLNHLGATHTLSTTAVVGPRFLVECCSG